MTRDELHDYLVERTVQLQMALLELELLKAQMADRYVGVKVYDWNREGD